MIYSFWNSKYSTLRKQAVNTEDVGFLYLCPCYPKKEINRITQWPERNGLIGLKLEVIRKIVQGQLVFQS